MIKFKYVRKEGEIMPSFYYGIIYKEWMMNVEIYCIIPFNFLIRMFRAFRWIWARKVQRRLSRYDYSVRQLIHKIRQENNESHNILLGEKDRYFQAYLKVLKQCQDMNEMFPEKLKQDLTKFYQL